MIALSMAKYSFAQIGPEKFETMLKALLEQSYRVPGHLIQFGPGKDGAREATWTQPVDHPDYIPVKGVSRAREWVFQVKYHDTVRAGRRDLTSELISDLSSELDKLLNRYKTACDTYILVTNLPLSGVHAIGGRDRMQHATARWRNRIDIQVWDEAALSAMLDSNPGVRITYLDQILPGDILASLLRQTEKKEDHRRSIIRTYLTKLLQSNGVARSDEAGDEAEKPLKLEDVYIDLTVQLVSIPHDSTEEMAAAWAQLAAEIATDGEKPPTYWTANGQAHENSILVPASSALLLSPHEVTLVQAGPGFGKSTIGQFLTAFHASRLLPEMKVQWTRLAARITLPAHVDALKFDSMCATRLPFRIELRRYAEWRLNNTDGGMATYLAEMINRSAESRLTMSDVYDISSTNACVLILDGLDEVPNHESRRTIISDAEIFLTRTRQSGLPIQLLLTTRPQGYNREFDVFAPVTWTIANLSRSEFDAYCVAWLEERVEDSTERVEALTRVQQGMQSPDVTRLATTLLQATVILAIAKNKHDIPHERTSLFTKYVDVIFEREKNKSNLVKTFEHELHRLHELAGYTLHKAMESGSAGNITDEGFRSLLLTTWDVYSGSQPLPGGLRSTLDSIVEAARNRLVFLKGEGEFQNDIGFLLSSFREYFAAAHFRNDEHAERDRVFETLISHVSHWENVLLFYSGFQNAADQRGWISYLQESPCHLREEERRFEAIRFRRTLLKMLPEFRGIKKYTFEMALREVLHVDTLWSWRSQSWASDILRALKQGSAVEFILSVLYLVADRDRDTFAAAFELAANIVPRQGIIWTSFVAKLNEFTNTIYRSIAFQIAFDWGVPILSIANMSAAEACVLFDDNRHVNQYHNEVAALIPVDIACNLLNIRWSHTYHRLGKNAAVAAITSALSPRDAALSRDGCAIVPFRFLCSSDSVAVPEQLKSVVRKLKISDHDLGKHITAIADAMSHPVDPELDRHARSTQARMKSGNIAQLNCNYLLGPAPESFSSEDDWIIFKNLLVTSRDQDSWLPSLVTTYGADTNTSSHDWIRGLFHPRAWRLLQQTYCPSGHLSEISSSPNSVEAVLQLSPTALAVLDTSTWQIFSDEQQSRLDVLGLAAVAIEVTRSFGSGTLSSSILPVLAASQEQRQLDWLSIESMLNSADQLEWSENWTSFFLVAALSATDLRAEPIYNFWLKNKRPRIYLSSPLMRKDTFEGIWNLATSGDPTAAEFGAEIAGKVRWRSDNSDATQIVDRFISEISTQFSSADSRRLRRFASAIVNLPLLPRQYKILASPLFYEIIDNAAYPDRGLVAERIGNEKSGMPLEFADSILERRLEFPSEIVIAAARRTVALRGKSTLAISESAWRDPLAK